MFRSELSTTAANSRSSHAAVLLLMHRPDRSKDRVNHPFAVIANFPAAVRPCGRAASGATAREGGWRVVTNSAQPAERHAPVVRELVLRPPAPARSLETHGDICGPAGCRRQAGRSALLPPGRPGLRGEDRRTDGKAGCVAQARSAGGRLSVAHSYDRGATASFCPRSTP